MLRHRRRRKCDLTRRHVHCQGRDIELTGRYLVGLSSDIHERFLLASGTSKTSTTSDAAMCCARANSNHQVLAAACQLPVYETVPLELFTSSLTAPTSSTPGVSQFPPVPFALGNPPDVSTGDRAGSGEGGGESSTGRVRPPRSLAEGIVRFGNSLESRQGHSHGRR